jgi:hypothetical protein
VLRGDPGLGTMACPFSWNLMEVQMHSLHTMPRRLTFSIVSACAILFAALITSSPSSAQPAPAQPAPAGKTYTLSGESLRG